MTQNEHPVEVMVTKTSENMEMIYQGLRSRRESVARHLYSIRDVPNPKCKLNLELVRKFRDSPRRFQRNFRYFHRISRDFIG